MSKFAKYLAVITVLILSGFGVSNAQIADTSIKVNIPDSFVVSGKVLPAGEYTIRRTACTVDSPTLLVMQGDGGAVLFDTVATISPAAAKDTKLIFEKAGNLLYLSEIWVRGETVGNQILGVKAEVTKIARAKTVKSKADTTSF